jgi:hypothetical protein
MFQYRTLHAQLTIYGRHFTLPSSYNALAFTITLYDAVCNHTQWKQHFLGIRMQATNSVTVSVNYNGYFRGLRYLEQRQQF